MKKKRLVIQMICAVLLLSCMLTALPGCSHPPTFEEAYLPVTSISL